MQFIGRACLRPGLFLHFGDRRCVKETEAVAAPAAAGFRSTPRVNRLSAALLERRIIQKRIRPRVQNLSSERRRFWQITGDAADLVAFDLAQHFFQTLNVHRFAQAIVNRLLHEWMIGNLAVSNDVFETRELVRKNRGQKIFRFHSLERGGDF